MRRFPGFLTSVLVAVAAFSAVPTASEAHWWWYGGSGGGSTGGSGTNTSTTAKGFARTYVSPGGDDANGCSVNDPCRTFQRAHDRSFINGEINCTEAGGYGPVTITKSITIDCKEVPASINAGTANTIGISINIPTSSADPLRVVRLRGLAISGAGQTAGNTSLTGTGTRFGLRGIHVQSASAVYVEHVVISDFTAQGILVGAPAKVFIVDTVVRNNGGTGITNTPNQAASLILDNVRSEGNNYGLAIGATGTAMSTRSVFSGNTTGGVEIDLGGTSNVTNSAISHNGTGVVTLGPGMRISNSDIAFNTTGASGNWVSFGNNRISGNGSAGIAPTPAGAASSDAGQQ